MVTMNDVARKANVSVSTVSRVLNGTGRISSEKRKEIMRIIEELRYIPNHHARNMTRERMMAFGLVVSDITNPFFSELTHGVEEGLESNGLLILMDSFRNPSREEELARKLKDNGAKGIILGNSRVDDGFIEYISQFLPTVVFDKEYEKDNVISITLDNHYGAYTATKHLIEKGCRTVVHLGGTSELLVSVQRANGYEEAMKNAGLEPKRIETGYDKASGYASARKLFESGKKIDGFFCMNDLVAVGAMKAAVEAGARIPEDTAFVGFDDTNLCNFTTPALSSVHQPAEDMGRAAARLLLEFINGTSKVSRYVFSPTLVIRGSSCRKEKTYGKRT